MKVLSVVLLMLGTTLRESPTEVFQSNKNAVQFAAALPVSASRDGGVRARPSLPEVNPAADAEEEDSNGFSAGSAPDDDDEEDWEIGDESDGPDGAQGGDGGTPPNLNEDERSTRQKPPDLGERPRQARARLGKRKGAGAKLQAPKVRLPRSWRTRGPSLAQTSREIRTPRHARKQLGGRAKDYLAKGFVALGFLIVFVMGCALLYRPRVSWGIEQVAVVWGPSEEQPKVIASWRRRAVALAAIALVVLLLYERDATRQWMPALHIPSGSTGSEILWTPTLPSNRLIILTALAGVAGLAAPLARFLRGGEKESSAEEASGKGEDDDDETRRQASRADGRVFAPGKKEAEESSFEESETLSQTTPGDQREDAWDGKIFVEREETGRRGEEYEKKHVAYWGDKGIKKDTSEGVESGLGKEFSSSVMDGSVSTLPAETGQDARLSIKKEAEDLMEQEDDLQSFSENREADGGSLREEEEGWDETGGESIGDEERESINSGRLSSIMPYGEDKEAKAASGKDMSSKDLDDIDRPASSSTSALSLPGTAAKPEKSTEGSNETRKETEKSAIATKKAEAARGRIEEMLDVLGNTTPEEFQASIDSLNQRVFEKPVSRIKEYIETYSKTTDKILKMFRYSRLLVIHQIVRLHALHDAVQEVVDGLSESAAHHQAQVDLVKQNFASWEADIYDIEAKIIAAAEVFVGTYARINRAGYNVGRNYLEAEVAALKTRIVVVKVNVMKILQSVSRLGVEVPASKAMQKEASGLDPELVEEECKDAAEAKAEKEYDALKMSVNVQDQEVLAGLPITLFFCRRRPCKGSGTFFSKRDLRCLRLPFALGSAASYWKADGGVLRGVL
ncbi:hypothetical protein CSUI_004208 [Cystoisospora suis]|uniref:Transmembrane protein n=1 Tax=Cystoisospora suis TaxID=483139 RepID=A0A2C6L1C6_9APIC|nr:hypothetical protein CSUI_004208 [Cystoisospora suis]